MTLVRTITRRAALCALVMACALGGALASVPDDSIAGLPNFARVDATLWRGAQPTDQGLDTLRRMGAGIVVNLRGDAATSPERGRVEALGMRYVALPMSGVRAPREADVAQFLALFRDNRGVPVFVHCRRGAERTGLVVAAYRVRVGQWSADAALGEMRAFHFRAALYPHYRHWVRRLARSPAAAAAKPAQARAS